MHLGLSHLLAKALVWVAIYSAVPHALAETCESEDACLSAYATATVMRDTPIDLQAAETALRRGCEQPTTGKACRILGYLIGRGVFAGSSAQKNDLTHKGCMAGDAIACRLVANVWITPDTWDAPRTAEYMTVRTMLEGACAGGDDFVCRKLVRHVSTEDAARYDKKCNAGATAYCALRGGLDFYPYDQTKEDARRAEAIFRSQCEAGEGLGCIFLADLIESGHGSDPVEKRMPHIRRACELGVGHGCDVAYSIAMARGPKPSRDAALSMLQTGCKANNSMACVEYAKLRRWDSDATKIAYAETLRDDCLAGGWRSCNRAAGAFEAIRVRAKLDEKFDDVDQMIQNFFDFAEVLKRRQ